MTWLLGQLWPWMVLSGVLGFASCALMATRRLTLEHRVEVPVEPVVIAEEAVVPSKEPPRVDHAPPVHASPFPGLLGAQRPWEAEETWSRPVRQPVGD